MKPLIVQKYGGSSLSEPAQIRDVAKRVAELHQAGHRVLVVVSAMGKTTDQLVDLAYQVSPSPNRRELDMLLTTGERVSMALMSMALNELGCPAISFTGSQAGLFTDEAHSNARINDIRPTRVESELSRGTVVVLAGFQGVSPRTKEVTTLGRGGSDTTAVAMSAYFRAERCEILKDVDGVRSADPSVIKNTEHISKLHYLQLLEMTFWGAKVLHYRSVELAYLLNIPIIITLAHPKTESTPESGPPPESKTHLAHQTMVDGDAPMYEQARILSVNSHKDVRWIEVKRPDLGVSLDTLAQHLKMAGLPLPQFLDSEKRGDSWTFLVTASTETLNATAKLTEQENPLAMIIAAHPLASVTATCQGTFASPLPQEIASALAARAVVVHKMIFSALSVTVVVDAKDREKSIDLIHNLKLMPLAPVSTGA